MRKVSDFAGFFYFIRKFLSNFKEKKEKTILFVNYQKIQKVLN